MLADCRWLLLSLCADLRLDVLIYVCMIFAEGEINPICPLQHFLPFPPSRNMREMVVPHVLEGKSYIWKTFGLT